MNKMESFSIWLRFYTKTNLSAGNPLKIVPMATSFFFLIMIAKLSEHNDDFDFAYNLDELGM